MKLTFRWYGKEDLIPLSYIKQIPNMSGVVSAVYDVPVGEVWSESSIQEIKDLALAAGLDFEVVESIPVHEDIKLGEPSAKKYIDNYCENIRRLAKHGVKVICYNFMPVFDWLRSDLNKINPDGSSSLSYDHETVLNLNPLESDLSLPGWDESYSKDGLKNLLNKYSTISKEQLWSNFAFFLKNVIPVAEESGVKMAIHPDDPPWDIFSLPRIVSNDEDFERLTSIVDSPSNGITLCTGSLGPNPKNDVLQMLDKYAKKDRVSFVHLRNIKMTGEKSFEETDHYNEEGVIDAVDILKVLHKHNYQGYIRPDHGRMIWGEEGRPGYGLYDRALGAAYINGIWQTLSKQNGEERR